MATVHVNVKNAQHKDFHKEIHPGNVEQTGDETPAVIASTASPYKFSKAVLEAVAPDSVLPENEFDMVDKLNEITKTAVPAPLAGLKNKTARFSDVTEVDLMPQYVLGALNIE